MQIHGVIFVVDSGSPDRLDEAKEVFSDVVQHEKIKGKPLLIFANKQDLEESVDNDAVAQHLDLDALLGDNRENSIVVRRKKWLSMLIRDTVAIISSMIESGQPSGEMCCSKECHPKPS